jgi:hypothetical protein
MYYNFFWLMPENFVRRSGHQMYVSEVRLTAADTPDLLDVRKQVKISLETL